MLAGEERPGVPADGVSGQQSPTDDGGGQQPVAGGGRGQQGGHARGMVSNSGGATPQNQGSEHPHGACYRGGERVGVLGIRVTRDITSGIARNFPGGLHQETDREVRQGPVPSAPEREESGRGGQTAIQATVGSTMQPTHLTRHDKFYEVNQLARPIHQRRTWEKPYTSVPSRGVDFSIAYNKGCLGSSIMRAPTGVLTRTTRGQLSCKVKHIIDIERSSVASARRGSLRSNKRVYLFPQAL